uniref:Bardet-Biedl syndrome 2 protein homolog n=1 Tax=Ciona savignyi TaxID=51511 RepID=H2YY40_CIOSA
MLVPIFTLKIKHKIHPRMVTVGKYDGLHPCLTCGTTASKVFVHNPHSPAIAGGRVAVQDSDISMLTMNQSVSALCAGQLDPSNDRDVLCIGTQTNLLAYDVHDNKDLFYKEVGKMWSVDFCFCLQVATCLQFCYGVNNIVMGKISSVDVPLVIAGGNCTLQGFDHEGEDRFWTVTGDIVSSLALVDFTNDGHNELLVGSEDFDIRVFQGDDIISEMTETEAVTGLYSISGSRFGYALANGTIGVYDRSARYWRIKKFFNLNLFTLCSSQSKNQVMAIHSFDLDGDGVPELITGWSNGKIDVRSNSTGEVMFKDNMTSAVAGIVDADYRLDGKNQLICCSVDGEVRGYQTDKSRLLAVDANRSNDNMRDLNLTKQNLLLELRNYEREQGPMKKEQFTPMERVEGGVIPASTTIATELVIEEKENPCIELVVSTNNNDTVVRMVVIYAEALYEGESHVTHPPANTLSNKIRVPIFPPKDSAIELHIQAFVSLPGSMNFHVFEVTNHLPSFSAYLYQQSVPQIPESCVSFTLNERVPRVGIWMTENFILRHEIPCEESIDAHFIALRGGDLVFKMDSSGQVQIHTDNIDLAGDLIQSLASFLRLDHLQVTAHFPLHLDKLNSIMSTVGFEQITDLWVLEGRCCQLHFPAQVNGLQSVTQKLAAEMTDHSNLIRSLVIRAEDARLQGDISNMKKGYIEVQDLNRDLVNGYKVRSANHQELVTSMKLVNQIIQKASHLRGELGWN